MSYQTIKRDDGEIIIIDDEAIEHLTRLQKELSDLYKLGAIRIVQYDKEVQMRPDAFEMNFPSGAQIYENGNYCEKNITVNGVKFLAVIDKP